MYDFIRVIKTWSSKDQKYTYKPGFRVVSPQSKDLMIRGSDFYALYNPETHFWEKNEAVAIDLIDKQIYEAVLEDVGADILKDPEKAPIIHRISNTENGLIDRWHKFVKKDMRDYYHPLNQKVLFKGSEVKKTDYATFTLPYPILDMPTPYYRKLRDTLYLPVESEKFEWAIGSILAGDQKKIDKIFIFYGLPGSGKGTIISEVMVNTIFGGKEDEDDHKENSYAKKFQVDSLTGKSDYGTGFLSKDPVLAYDADAHFSNMSDVTILNGIISHERTRVNPKYGHVFYIKPSCMLIAATNDTVSLSLQSGMTRRVVDIRQTGDLLSPDEYDDCIEHLKYEASGIAYHCLQVYKSKGKNYYRHYIPESMLTMTSPMHNFVKDNYSNLKNGGSLSNFYKMYKTYAAECEYKTVLTQYKFRDQLRLYFTDYGTFQDEEGNVHQRWFSGFMPERIGMEPVNKPTPTKSVESWLVLKEQHSVLDDICANYPAQYTKEDGTPSTSWDNCKTYLSDLDTTKLHYLKLPVNHIVVDLDIPNENGEKDLEANLKEAQKFPPTYAEVSKSGGGIHLHYIWKGGDPRELVRVIKDHVEVKVYDGKSSLRRKRTLCNDILVSELSTGLPVREKKMVDKVSFKSERELRKFVESCMQKKHHGYTTPEVQFIKAKLDEMYASGITYDIYDMRKRIEAFALGSTNKPEYCDGLVQQMKFRSADCERVEENPVIYIPDHTSKEWLNSPILILDVESAPSSRQTGDGQGNPAVFILCWKFSKIDGKDHPVHKMINPKPADVQKLFEYRIIGFNNRKYDNHMIYARAMGYSAEELYSLSDRMINGSAELSNQSKFGPAYNLSYTDIYDYMSNPNKMSLKKWEIKLGIHYQEWPMAWDESVPKDRWDEFADYCCNDVEATDAVFCATQGDFDARVMLSDISGLSVNATTNQHTIEILTHNIPDPTSQYRHPDLRDTFPGYKAAKDFGKPCFDKSEYNPWAKIGSHHKTVYLGEDPGEGGYKIGYPGVYSDVTLFDVESMHPHSERAMKNWGPIVDERFGALLEGRLAVKHIKRYGDESFNSAISYMNDLKPGLGDSLSDRLKGLDGDDFKRITKSISNALKTAINSCYGLTAAKFDNKLRIPDNWDNVIAKRGALFMIQLKQRLWDMGVTVVHVSVDSIKVSGITEDQKNYILNFAKQFGYNFEIEAHFKKLCLLDDTNYLALQDQADEEPIEPKWVITGSVFDIPVFKKMYLDPQPITVKDYAMVIASSKGALYFRYDDGRLKFIGRVGEFIPVKTGGHDLLHIDKVAGREGFASGTKGYKMLESIEVSSLDDVDTTLALKKTNDVLQKIDIYCDHELFLDKNVSVENNVKDINRDASKTFEWYRKQADLDGFMNIPDGVDEELPF